MQQSDGPSKWKCNMQRVDCHDGVRTQMQCPLYTLVAYSVFDDLRVGQAVGIQPSHQAFERKTTTGQANDSLHLEQQDQGGRPNWLPELR